MADPWWLPCVGERCFDFRALRRGCPSADLCRDPAELRRALAAGVSPNIKDGGTALLQTAISRDFLESAKILLDAGADADSALRDAFTHGSFEVARHLIARGFDPNSANRTGWTPLHSHCCTVHPRDRIWGGWRILIDAGADFNRRDAHGRSPLNILSDHSSEDFVQELRAYAETAARRRVGRHTKPAARTSRPKPAARTSRPSGTLADCV